MHNTKNKLEKTGIAIQKTGKALFGLITLPILGFLCFNLVGLFVGLLIGLGIFGNAISDKKK